MLRSDFNEIPCISRKQRRPKIPFGLFRVTFIKNSFRSSRHESTEKLQSSPAENCMPSCYTRAPSPQLVRLHSSRSLRFKMNLWKSVCSGKILQSLLYFLLGCTFPRTKIRFRCFCRGKIDFY